MLMMRSVDSHKSILLTCIIFLSTAGSIESYILPADAELHLGNTHLKLAIPGNDLQQHMEQSQQIVTYVSDFRNASGVYFNIIFENKPNNSCFQFHDLTDDQLQSYRNMANTYGYCQTFQYTYRLQNQLVKRHFAVFEMEKNCKYQFRETTGVHATLGEIWAAMPRKKYVVTGISTYQDLQLDSNGFNPILKFIVTIKQLTNPSYFYAVIVSNRDILLDFRRKMKAKNLRPCVPMYIQGTYFMSSSNGPTHHNIICYKSRTRDVQKSDVNLLHYSESQKQNFQLLPSLIQRDLDSEEYQDMVIKSAIVKYSSGKWDLHILLVKKSILEFFE